jgi:F subunit of K+-transporting ATPase (Potass_KdpF)
MSAAILAAAVDNWIGLGLAAAAAAYLVVVLVFPERF